MHPSSESSELVRVYPDHILCESNHQVTDMSVQPRSIQREHACMKDYLEIFLKD